MTLRFVERLRDVIGGVEVILSDIWGVVHNGLESFPEACAALDTYRKAGFRVVRSESKELQDPRVLWPDIYRWPPK